MPLPFEVFVGLPYLRAKRRSRTISLNTLVSVGGSTLDVAALMASIGIMTGCKEDVQAKILKTAAHIVVLDRVGQSMTRYDPIVSQVVTVPGVVAATPFISKQGLLTTQRGARGALIRGIDSQPEATVTELAKDLSNGALNHLSPPVEGKRSSAKNPSDSAVEVDMPGIILGKELATHLEISVGDTANVVASSTGASSVSIIGMVPKIQTFGQTRTRCWATL